MMVTFGAFNSSEFVQPSVQNSDQIPKNVTNLFIQEKYVLRHYKLGRKTIVELQHLVHSSGGLTFCATFLGRCAQFQLSFFQIALQSWKLIDVDVPTVTTSEIALSAVWQLNEANISTFFMMLNISCSRQGRNLKMNFGFWRFSQPLFREEWFVRTLQL